MPRLIVIVAALSAILSAAAQTASALPADRLALANQLSRRGLYADALKEYEALRGSTAVPRDEVLFRLGETYRLLERKSEALKCYEQLLANVPESRYTDYARLNRAALLDGSARDKELRELDRSTADKNIRATALYYLGESAETAKDAKAAIDFYTRAAKLAGSNEMARVASMRSAGLLAASADAEDRKQALITYLNLAHSPDRRLVEESLFFAGMISYRDGRYPAAATIFHNLAMQFPKGARTRESAIYAAWANYLSGRTAEALEIASPLRGGNLEDAWYITAASLKALERRADAMAAYDAALAKFPTGRYADVEWTDRLELIASAGNHAGVLAELKARVTPPKGTEDRAWSYGYEAAIALTNYPSAIEFARLVAGKKDSPLAPNAHHSLAWLLEKTGDWRGAAGTYRRLAEQWPKSALAAQALYQAGVAEIRARRPEQARSDWTNLLTRYPESPFAAEALYARAMEEIRAKEYRAAHRSLTELFKRFPETPKRVEATYWRGVAAKGSNDLPEAEKLFREALAAKPTAEFEREIKLELADILQKRGADIEAATILASLVGTKAVSRISSADLQWVAEEMLTVTNWNAAAAAAQAIAARKTDAAWNQIAATLEGAAREGAGERDAATAAYTRALATGTNTIYRTQAALALGKIETSLGLFDEAKAHLTDAVETSGSRDRLNMRVQAYAALAANEEERGDAAAALGYHMLVGTLFDDPEAVPFALTRAAKILRAQGRAKEADALLAERKKRYPKVKIEE